MKVKITIQNTTESRYSKNIFNRKHPEEMKEIKSAVLMFDQVIKQGTNEIEVTCPMGDHPNLWDEFEPNLYRLKVEMSDGDGRTRQQ